MHYLENWYEEKRSAYLYNIIAAHETHDARKKLFRELATMANHQADIWINEMQKSGQNLPKDFQPDLRTRCIGKLIHYFGAKYLRFILSAMKVRGMSVFLEQDPNYPFSSTLVHHESRHKGMSSASNLRAAIFGVNDGLISNMSLLLGVTGASGDLHYIILTGVAGLLAGACSMSAGEYVSVRSQKEFYEHQIDLERGELEQYPDEEAHELSVIYQARGLPKKDADKLSKILISDPEKALDTLAREELGLNPKDLGSPWGAAISSFFSFGFGAFIPLIPFLFGLHTWNLWVSIGLTAFALFSIGGTLSLFTSGSAIKSGLRMLLIGAAAGVFTYLIGKMIGVTMH